MLRGALMAAGLVFIYLVLVLGICAFFRVGAGPDGVWGDRR